MEDISQQIEGIQKEIRETPYHKGTEHHIGMLRARLARLKDKLIESEIKSSGGGGGGGYAVKKHGDATVVLVGPPSVGKSTLINRLTNANSKIAAYAFTTVSVIPGMMDYNHARIQILDVPGLIEGAEEGKGRGREVLSVVRGADLLVLISEPSKLDAFPRIYEALERNGIRINKRPPEIIFTKATGGGLTIKSNIKQDFDKETIKAVAAEMGLKNGEITIKEKVTLDELIDSLSRNRVYIPAIFVVNKSDLIKEGETIDNAVLISSDKETGLEEFKQTIWKALGFVTVYLVKTDEEPSEESPIIVKKDQTLLQVAQKIGEGFAAGKTNAVIWGTGSKFSGQEVSLSTLVQDGMQIRFV